MAFTLSASVGQAGANHPYDVITIQSMLNRIPLEQGGPNPRLSEDGLVGPRTIDAIRRFQQHHGLAVDGRIDPNGRTLAKLNQLLLQAVAKVTFWMRAFIPKDIPGLTQSIPNHDALTMISGPTPVNDCFLTDQRSFDSDKGASSRMHAEAIVDFDDSIPGLTQVHRCDPTVEVDCEDGDVECSEQAKTTAMAFVMGTSSSARLAVLHMKCAASNPCFRGAPDIDFEGRITIDADARSVEFDGKIDAFPAFEAYAAINDGAAFPLFTVPPLPGNSPDDLFGGANRAIRCKIADEDGDGVFEMRTVLAQP